MSDNTLDPKAIHDLLLAAKPSEASHDASLCPLCEGSGDGAGPHNDDDTLGGDVSTYTQDELDAAVAEAVAPIQEKLDALLTEQGAAEQEARIAEMTEAHAAEVAEYQTQIDAAKAEAEAAKAELTELVSLIEESQVAEAAAEALAARKEEVKAAVAGLFTDEYVESNLERWAGLEAEAFDAQVDDWKAAAEAAKTAASASKKDDGLGAPASTAMENGSEQSQRSVADIRKELHARANDVRTVGSSYTGGLT